MKIFDPQGGLYRWMNRVYQLMILNILLLLSCLPIFTIGSAFCAAYGVAFKLQNYEEKNIFLSYINQFKKNWKVGMWYWGSLICLGGLFFVSYPLFRSILMSNQLIFYLFMIILTVLILASMYVFPLLARYENSLKNTILNALVLSLKHLPYSIVIFFMCVGIGILIPLKLPKLFFLWLMLAGGSLVYFSSLIFKKIFSYYEEKETLSEGR